MTNEQLVLRIRSREDVADNMAALYEQNRGMIAKLANKYCHYAEYDDLIQEGYFGLSKAVDVWDSERGNFITCAVILIKQQMWRYIYNNGSSIRVSIPAQENVRKYEKIRQQCLKHWGREPQDFEMCYFMGIKQKQLDLIKSDAVRSNVGSLDKCVGEDEDTTLRELIPDQVDHYEVLFDNLQLEELKKVIWPIVDALPDEQPKVIRMKFQDCMTRKEIGAELGIAESKVRTLENNAIYEIRFSKNKRILSPFFYGEEIRSKAMQGTGLTSFKHSWTSATEREALRALEPN